MSIQAVELLNREKSRPLGRIQTVIRVQESGRYVGNILLDGKMRVWRHADTIPADVVLKALVAISRRGETQGELVGRSDGLVYAWSVVTERVD